MRAGSLDRNIRIEKRTDVANAVGQSTPTWSVFAASVPASFEPQRGREYFAAQGLAVVEPAVFRIHHRAGVVAQMRVKFEDKIWDIAAVEPIGRNVGMILYCATGLTEG